MDFPSKPGCPMCSIVNMATLPSPSSSVDVHASTSPGLPPSPYSAQLSPSFPSNSSSNVYLPTVQSPPPLSPASSSSGSLQNTRRTSKDADTPEIVYRDTNFTVYRERNSPVSSRGHLVFVFNLHVPSLYMLSSSDVPLLNSLRSTAHRLLSQLSSSAPSSTPPSSPPHVPLSPASLTSNSSPGLAPSSPQNTPQFRIGFITPPWKDSQIPVKDHLHAHAYIAPADLLGWWRRVAYSPIAWYAIEDLIAEIREESSNNRIRSSDNDEDGSNVGTGNGGGRGNTVRKVRPIDRVPDAGARSGTANGVETTGESLSMMTDLEAGNNRRASGSGMGNMSPRTGTGTRTSLSPNVNPNQNSWGGGGRRGKSPSLGPVPPRPAKLASPSHLDLSSAVALTYIHSSSSISSISISVSGDGSSGPSSPTMPIVGSGSGSGKRGLGLGVVSGEGDADGDVGGSSRPGSWYGMNDPKVTLLPPASS